MYGVMIHEKNNMEKNKMKKFIWLMVIGLMFLCGNVYAQGVGILGVELGEPLVSCEESEGKRPCLHRGLTVLSYPEHGLGSLYAWLDSSGSKVMMIMLLFDPDKKGDLILELLTGKFGPPHKIKRFMSQNRMGVSFDNISANWFIKGHAISFRKRGSKVNEGDLFLYHKDKLREMSEEERDKAKGLKKTF
jgi:hypothetical protein